MAFQRFRQLNKRHRVLGPLALIVLAVLGGVGFEFLTHRLDPSANAAVSCIAESTSIENVLGGQLNTQGGALQVGGAYSSIPDKRSLVPPCLIGFSPTFVEIDNVIVYTTVAETVATGSFDCSLFPSGLFCDSTFDVVTSEFSSQACPSCYQHRIHVEIDQTWKANGIAPPSNLRVGDVINIQGFVFWDSEHTGSLWHSYSGWEIHPLTFVEFANGTSLK